MHTVNNLFKKICAVDNVALAVEKAAKGKRYKRAVQKVLANPQQTINNISKVLSREEWTPCEVHKVREINDGINLKRRQIVCPQFVREQVVHHAIMNICRPVFLRALYKYCCASIPGRGVEYALAGIRKALRSKKAKYFAVLDIKQFFNSIRPSKVFHRLRCVIRCRKTLALHARILRGNKVKLPDGTYAKRGTPIGFYTSPWYANLLLTPLDHHIKEGLAVPFYFRYNDDMLLIGSNKRKLRKAIASIKEELAKLGLQIKREPQIHQIGKVPIRYIGYLITKDKAILLEKCFLKAKRTAARIKRKGYITLYDARKITSYGGRFKHVNARLAFRKYIDEKVPVKKCRQIISERSKEECGLNPNLTKDP